MRRRILAVSVLAAFFGVLGNAQTSPPTAAQMVANQVTRLTKLLDLNSTQQASATTIFTTQQTTLATIRTSMQTARTALKTAITTGDTNTIGTTSTQIGTLTGEEVLAQATASAAFYAMLTSDQQTKYETLGPLSGPGGFGGPGGPGGGPGPHGLGGSH